MKSKIRYAIPPTRFKDENDQTRYGIPSGLYNQNLLKR
jgi:hypothetical protein